MKTKNLVLLALACVSVPMAAQAKVISGSANGMTWEAQSRIVGVTSTATIAGGGNPIYGATAAKYKGTVGLLMTYANGDAFVCSGSLMADRKSILTAGHCVSDGAGTANPVSTKAFFYGGTDQDVNIYDPANAGLVTTRDVTNYFVNSNYTGEVIDQNDIAVLRLSDFAPTFATAYDLFAGNDLTGTGFNTAGYGARSNGGGNVGANLGTGRLRQGDNRYDFRLGDSDFGGFFTDIDPATGENFFGRADIRFSYLSDFDNGLAANDASCALAVNAFSLGGSKYCNLGVGALEVSVAGGDSGGPQFVNGRVASVTSYGLSFGPNFGDIGGGLNSSFGEFNGFVPVSIHRAFIFSSMVPEPATWAMMIGGFGMIGASMRFRRRSDVSARATA